MNTFIVAGELKSFLAVGRTLTIHRFPSVGFERHERAFGRQDFNNPPISIGGIHKEGVPVEGGRSFERKTKGITLSLGYCDLFPQVGPDGGLLYA